MRTLLMVLMIAGMMSTVGVYATSFGSTPTTKTLAGSGDETVSAPNTGNVDLAWVFTGDQVSAVAVTWTPGDTINYKINVGAGGQTGELTGVPGVLSTPRTDNVVLGAPVEASAITTAKVVISAE